MIETRHLKNVVIFIQKVLCCQEKLEILINFAINIEYSSLEDSFLSVKIRGPLRK